MTTNPATALPVHGVFCASATPVLSDGTPDHATFANNMNGTWNLISLRLPIGFGVAEPAGDCRLAHCAHFTSRTMTTRTFYRVQHAELQHLHQGFPSVRSVCTQGLGYDDAVSNTPVLHVKTVKKNG